MDIKYPKTLYWPYSPAPGRNERVHPNPRRFVGEQVVVTEKLDGSNTLLHLGRVYARAASTPCYDKWMAMVKKHHAWKVQEPDCFLFGEDIYGVHSISYDPIREHRTFYAFALQSGDGGFRSFAEVEEYTSRREIPMVPVLFKGIFNTIGEARAFVARAHNETSLLGGDREGVVLRLARGFPASEFQNNVCKSVRRSHVQSSEHWSKNWRPCDITVDTT